MFLVVKKEYKIMYVIVKLIKMVDNNTEVPVILLDGEDEIMEFNTYDDAEKIRTLFEKNSDSGYKYVIKKI